MFTPSSWQALGEVLRPQVSSLEPDLAQELTDMISEMEDEDIIQLSVAGSHLYPHFYR